jgi:prepilin-type N-terminal cleavage/methylation domain-containing protein
LNKALFCSNRGSSFIELLVALAILGIVVTPFLNLFGFSSTFINNACLQSTAVNLCRSQLEKTKALGYNQVYFYYVDEHNSPLIEDEPDGFPGFRRETVVSNFLLPLTETELQGIDLLQIDVTVSWQEREKEHSETLSTYICKR